MPLVPSDATFALLGFNRRPRQAPVHDRMAPRMKIQPLLADGRGSEDEWPERRIERGADSVQPAHRAVCFLDLGKTHRMPTAQANEIGAGGNVASTTAFQAAHVN